MSFTQHLQYLENAIGSLGLSLEYLGLAGRPDEEKAGIQAEIEKLMQIRIELLEQGSTTSKSKKHKQKGA